MASVNESLPLHDFPNLKILTKFNELVYLIAITYPFMRSCWCWASYNSGRLSWLAALLLVLHSTHRLWLRLLVFIVRTGGLCLIIYWFD